MQFSQVQFSVASHAAWAPGLTTSDAWQKWAQSPYRIEGEDTAPVESMPSMLRRRAGFLSRMALEVAYQCANGEKNMPTVFCSRYGDVLRSFELLSAMVDKEPTSPTKFSLSVHNADAGLFSIARQDQANHTALAAGSCTVEHGVIEACGLLAEGAKSVLLVVYDSKLPEIYRDYQDCEEQPHAWAWMLVPAGRDVLKLSWSRADDESENNNLPGSLAVWQFYLNQQMVLERVAQRRLWRWSRHA